ncbi:MAG: aldo/keto reductase [Planctomycetes bacterium]|nr:aldo/keto reductase [Planctomycetota bacterium]MCW8134339.1 aldo/keto reductase [Planctomycetota bacterium]
MRTAAVSRINRPLPLVGQGTWEMGNKRAQREAEAAALRLGLDLGMTLIDTAEMYASGGAEEVVAQAIKGRDVFVETKVLPGNASRKGTIKACEASLKRLGIECIDLYLLHWPGSYLLEDTIAAFEELAKAGKIAHWGVSNFDVQGMREVEALAPGRCACNQVLYNVCARGPDWELIKWCQDHGILFQAYSPLGQGNLPWKKLAPIATRHHATPAQVALAFSARLAGMQTIPKTSRPQRVRENAAAADIVLTSQDLAELDRAFAPPNGPTPLETA